MRNFLFKTAYWVTSIFFALLAVPLLALPRRKPVMLWIRLYTRTMCFWMRVIGGITITIKGHHNIPEGQCIIAAKHQSWGDGFIMFSQFFDLAFVTGDHLEKLPLLGAILRKMGAIIVDNCGGAYARAKLVDSEMKIARDQGRRILIYPEGHLSPVGHHHRYRKGVFHMYTAYEKPVIPVATNLGVFWPEQQWNLTPGEAIIEFLEPIQPGLEKDEFMDLLKHRIEKHSLDLIPDGVQIKPMTKEDLIPSQSLASLSNQS